MTEALAAVDGLTLRHVGRRAAALRELTFRWDRGERLLLLGASGSGKSTLALCLDGVIPHSLEVHWEAGAVRIAGRDTREADPGWLARTIGVAFQDPETQLAMLEVDDEIAFGLENLGLDRATIRTRIAEARAALALTGIPRAIDELSGGTKQRVALASLIAMRPSGLVLDEPTANLDPAGARELLDAVAGLAADRDRSILLIEHRIDDVLPLVDRVVALDGDGRVAVDGPPDIVFVRDAAACEALGLWTPQLAALAGLLGSDALPRGAAAAADLIVARWPERAGCAASAPPSGPALLRAEGVSFAYGRRGVLRDASIELRRGELVALVGANGAGKSTLGLLLAGALRPDRGRVSADGRVAYVFQYPEHQFVARTVADELRVTLRARLRAANVERRCAALLAEIGLDRLAEANPFSLSHGQKRRLSVATALAADPDVLILDEPTFGQDRVQTERLMARLHALCAAGRAVLVLTHDLGLVADHASRVVALADATVLRDGPASELFADDSVLARARLRRPVVAEAFRLAHERRTDVPRLSGLAAAQAALRG